MLVTNEIEKSLFSDFYQIGGKKSKKRRSKSRPKKSKKSNLRRKVHKKKKRNTRKRH